MKNVIYKSRDKKVIKSFSFLWSRSFTVMDNIKYLILEVLFSKQITKIMLDTASMPFEEPDSERTSRTIESTKSWRGDNGYVASIVDFLPATNFVQIIEKPLTEMLFHKYLNTYMFLIEGKATAANHTTISHAHKGALEYDITAVKYRVNKKLLPEMSAYNSKIEAIWLIIESIVASVSYALSNSLELTLLLLGLLELAKRFRI